MQPGVDPADRTPHAANMVRALVLSIGQLGDRQIIAVFLKSFMLTLAVLGALAAALLLGVRETLTRWLDTSSELATISAVVVLLFATLHLWVVFRAVAIAAIDAFGDEVVRAVEAKHYPAAHSTAKDLHFGRSVAMGLKSALRAIGINLLLSPLYLVLLFTGVGTPIAFFMVNAWLLGRDLGDMVAARHLGGAELTAWRGRTRIARFLLGAMSEALLWIPIVNFFAPVLSAAMATHVYHGRKG